MNYLRITCTVVCMFVLSGCASKEVYKPSDVKREWRTQGHLSAPIDQVCESGAVLSDGTLLGKNGIKKQKMPNGYRLINTDDTWTIAAKDGNVVLFSENGNDVNITLELNKNIAAASVQDDILALLFSNNEMALYSLESKKLLFKENANPPIAVDKRIANPRFLKELVLFLTLDGKVVIVNSVTKQTLRSVVISTEDFFNNVTYMNMIDNNLVASTGGAILSLSQKEAREKYDIRDILYTKEGIWITTKQGEIIALTSSLQLRAKKKFPFAHFRGIAMVADRLLVVEKEGYLISLSKDLATYDVYDVDFDNEDEVFFSEDKLYFNNRYIEFR